MTAYGPATVQKTVENALAQSLVPLDRLRAAWFRALRATGLLEAVFARRERRLTALVMLHAPLALLLAIYFPVHLFILAPLVLGVPHLAADVRYLLLRRDLPRSVTLVLLSGCASLLALGLMPLSARAAARAELAIATGLLLLVIRLARTGANALRSAVAVVLTSATGAAACLFPEMARLILLHGHNLVALCLLLLLFPRSGLQLKVLSTLAGGLSACLALGAFAKFTLCSAGVRGFHLHVLALADSIAPVASLNQAVGITCAYVFLQSVHYLVWLVLIPQQDLRTQATLTFQMSARSLVRDFGVVGVVGIGAVWLLVMVLGCFNPVRTQHGYLTLATFHIYLELGVLVHMWVRRRGSAA